MTIKQIVGVIVNSVPRLAADVYGLEWPSHAHAVHTGLDADDHVHYMLCTAGVARPFTGAVYFEDRLYGDSALTLDDHRRWLHTDGSGDWTQEGIELSSAPAEWQDFFDKFGEVSLIAAMAATGGVTLDGAYDYGGPGAGRTVSVTDGSVSFTVPSSGTDAALTLTNLESSNTSESLSIYNNATLSTGYSVYFQGAQGGDSDDNDEMGHLLWTQGSLTIGHGTPTGTTGRRSYTTYQYENDGTGGMSWAHAIMRADADTAWAESAYVMVSAGYGTSDRGEIMIGATGDISLLAGDDLYLSATLIDIDSTGIIRFDDVYRSGSSWGGQTFIALSASSAEWTAMETLIGSEGSIFAGILAATGLAYLAATQVGFGSSGGTLSGKSSFIFDETNNYLGVANATPACGFDVGGANPTYVTGSASIHATSEIETTNAYIKNNLYLPGLTTGSIPYLIGTPPYATENNTYFRYTGATSVLRAFSSAVAVPTTMELGATSTSSGEAATVLISASAASAAANVNIASSQNIDIYALYSLKLRTNGAGDVDISAIGDVNISATGDVILDGDEVSFESSKITNLKNMAWGTATAAGWSSGTVTANFSTGKDIQLQTVNADVTTLTLTPPTGGEAKTMRIVLENITATHDFGGANWASVLWPVSANPVVTPVSAANNDYVIIDLAYIGGIWFGEVDVWRYGLPE